jgi:hypothetical protein
VRRPGKDPAGDGRLDCTDERGIQRRDLPSPWRGCWSNTADAVQAVRGGKSLTDVLARLPADIRPGVQALSFHTLRWLGSATVARERLVPKPPAAQRGRAAGHRAGAAVAG